MSIIQDLVATSSAYLKVSLAGVRLKNNAGNLEIRDTGDTADAEITTSKVNISGEEIVLNSDAAGSGADWLMTVKRAVTGMTENLTWTLPDNKGTAGQVLKTDGSGVLDWASAAGTASSLKLNSTGLAFGTVSPVSMFSTGAGDIISAIEVVVDTAFDGSPSLSVGIAGTTSKYLSTTEVDLTTTATTVFKAHAGLDAQGIESLIATYAAGGATLGAARIITHFATPD